MKTTASAFVLVVVASVCRAGDSLIDDKMSSLHCTGERPKQVGTSEMTKAIAHVRVSKGMFYIKIDGLAYGTSAEAPSPKEATSLTGSIQLTPSPSKGRSMLANYTLNYSSGDLIVSPPNGGKAYFLGTCKKSVPLF